MRTRAWRRAQRDRMQAHAHRVMSKWYGEAKHKFNFHKIVSVARDNLPVCSCWMCCNPRRNEWADRRERMTMQERRAEDDFKDQMRELE